MKKKILIILLSLNLAMSITGCASWDRMLVDMKSDVTGGIERVINIYTANGDVIASYEGKIDIEENDSGAIKFDFNGKRYIYYNCFVETIGDIEY